MDVQSRRFKFNESAYCCSGSHHQSRFMKVDKELTKAEIAVLVAGFIFLIALVAGLSRPPFYDERYYIKNVFLLQQYGFSREYLLKHIGSAGPLYSAVHYVFAPLTHLRVPYIRLVNVFLLAGSMYFLGKTLQLLQFSANMALLVLAIPMTYVVTGLALTEVPAMFFFSAAIYSILYATTKSKYPIVYLIAGGFLMGLAILGRQPYLLTLGVLPILFWNKEAYIKNGLLLIVTIISALVLPAIVFSVWNGLVAPEDAALYTEIARNGISLQPKFFFFCTAYFAVIVLLLAPSIYLRPTRRLLAFLGIALLIFIAVNYSAGVITFLPMRFTLERLFSASFISGAELICGAVIMVLSVYLLLSIAQRVKENYSKELLFFVAATFLIALSCIKITWGYSSRYAAQAIPLIVPLCAVFYRRSKYNVYRLALGIVIGAVSLLTYIKSD